MEDCPHRFCSAELQLPSLEIFTHGCHVLGQHPFHCLPVSTACMIAQSSAYAYFLETVVGWSEMYCRCWREGAPRRIPVGGRFRGVVTCFVCRYRWYEEDDQCLHVALSVTVFLKCQPNLSLREQPLLPVLDVFSVDWVRPFQGAAASLLPRMTEDPAFCSWTLRGRLQTRSALLSS